MKKLRCKTRILCLPIMILVIHIGCTHLPPISDEVSDNLGTIGVFTSINNADLYLPRKPGTDWGEGCNKGAAEGAGGWAFGCLYAAPETLGLSLLLLPLTLVAAIIGCIAGGLSTESESEVQEAEALLKNAISELNIKKTLQYQFLSVAQKKTPYKFVVLESIESDDIKKKLNYSSLADKGVDTVIWIDISEISLVSKKSGGINPSLFFIMSCSVKLIRTIDGEVIYRHGWEKYCDDDEFVDWADNNAEPFRKEFSQCSKKVAKQIVKDLFLREPQKQVNEKPNYASISPEDSKPKSVAFDPNEPWTGTWKIKGFRDGDFVLKLKQSGNKVKSIGGSWYELKAKVKGDRLKGWYDIGYGVYPDINFILSEDCKSFMGKSRAPTAGSSGIAGTVNLKGERQE